MSILDLTDGVAFLDHESFLNRVYKDFNDESYRIQEKMFDINTPFLMDSAVQNYISKRKRKCSNEEFDSLSFSLENKYKFIHNLGKSKGFFKNGKPDNEVCMENNKSSRDINTLLKSPEISLKHLLYISHHVMHEVDSPNMFSVGDHNFLVPKNCTFHLGELSSSVEFLLQQSKKYDVVVIDPPWTNGFIKRKKGYQMLNNDDLLEKLKPLKSILAPKAIIIAWVTNKLKHIEFVKNDIFKSWNVKFLGEWFWIKVTKYGEPIYSFNSKQKKPYERLIIGRYCENIDSKNHCDKLEIPKDLILVSIPSSIHSHKPPLSDLLKTLVSDPDKKNYLELFARSLSPGWTCCGDQTVLLQSSKLFTSIV